MKRIRPAFVALATFLAVLLPLEQSHCAWMGVMPQAPLEQSHCASVGATPQAPSAAADASHACCRPGASPAPQPQPAADCSCMKLPAGSLPASLASASPSLGVAYALAEDVYAAAPAAAETPAPALDVGSPPLLMKLGAHGLRAPPRSA